MAEEPEPWIYTKERWTQKKTKPENEQSASQLDEQTLLSPLTSGNIEL